MFKPDSNLISAASGLVYRFVAFGDVYWYTYPNGYIDLVNVTSPFVSLFNDFMGLFRLANWNALPDSLGLSIYRMHHASDVIMVNPRLNIMGYIYFGYFGIVFSFVIGVIVGYIRLFLSKIC